MASRCVTIRHPGYELPVNLLLELPAREGSSRNQAYYPTVEAACQIITQHADDIWLQKPNTSERFQPDPDQLMTAGVYYLHTSSALPNHPYPIVPNWDTWNFPHDHIPQLWQEIVDVDMEYIPELVKSERCRITDKSLVLETAHIIPRNEKAWFNRNGMSTYASVSGRSGDVLLDATINTIRLQPTAHKLWDRLDFCIVPRKRTVEGSEQKEIGWTTQMMRDHSELETDWHNLPLLPLNGRAVEYLYARFAWHIFPRLVGFLLAGTPRQLTVAAENGSSLIRMFDAAECQRFTTNQGLGRGTSPTKRSHSLVESETVDDALVSDHGTNDNDDDHDDDNEHNNPASLSPGSVHSITPEISTDDHHIPTRRRRRSSDVLKPQWMWNEDEELYRGRKRTRI